MFAGLVLKGPWLEQKLPNGGGFLNQSPGQADELVLNQSHSPNKVSVLVKWHLRRAHGLCCAGGRQLGWRLEMPECCSPWAASLSGEKGLHPCVFPCVQHGGISLLCNRCVLL